REEGPDRSGTLALGKEALLGAAAQQRPRRPVGMRPREGDGSLETDPGAGTDREDDFARPPSR
ncbi:hypothetical protein, partial [Methylobacterium nigriterrae]|uniref:hypothetical protein n=1 Tax=Methylobacterium nigriterrae TaxID=3127512 RepID=UPI003013E066